MQKLNDPDFGIIYFDYGDRLKVLTLERQIEFNGYKIPLKIYPENKDTPAISAVQRQAVKIALNLPSDTLIKSAPAVIQNYECYDESLDGEALPELKDPVDIWNLVEPDCISVPAHSFLPYYEVTIPTFFLYAECFWDAEHGLEVRFRNGYADESDQRGHLRVEID